MSCTPAGGVCVLTSVRAAPEGMPRRKSCSSSSGVTWRVVAEDGVVGDSGAEAGGGRLGSVGLSLADFLLAVVLPVGDDEDLASCLAERLVARAVDLGGDGDAAADDARATAEAAWAHLLGKAAVDLAGLEGGGALVALGLARRGALATM